MTCRRGGQTVEWCAFAWMGVYRQVVKAVVFEVVLDAFAAQSGLPKVTAR